MRSSPPTPTRRPLRTNTRSPAGTRAECCSPDEGSTLSADKKRCIRTYSADQTTRDRHSVMRPTENLRSARGRSFPPDLQGLDGASPDSKRRPPGCDPGALPRIVPICRAFRDRKLEVARCGCPTFAGDSRELRPQKPALRPKPAPARRAPWGSPPDRPPMARASARRR